MPTCDKLYLSIEMGKTRRMCGSFVCFETWFLGVAVTVLELGSVDQASLQIRDPPVFASRTLGLKVFIITSSCMIEF